MTIKKSYNVGDPVWIYGISRTNSKLTKGRVLHTFNLKQQGYGNEKYYLIEIPNELDPLLEVRTWQMMSQDGRGPVGAFREAVAQPNAEVIDKKLSQLGLTVEDNWYDEDNEFTGDGHDGMGSFAEEDDPSPEQIHAAIEKAQQTATHPPLVFKDSKPKRRNFARKKKV
jgi:hypothetical protein